MSWPITLVDRPALMKQLAADPDHFASACTTTPVWAPCCGRKTAADTVVSLAGLKTEISGGNHQPKRDHDWACDGCLHLLVADQSNGWTWSNLFNALGAPDDVLRHYVAVEACREANLAASKRGEWFNEGEVYDLVYSSLPVNLKSDRATQRPDV